MNTTDKTTLPYMTLAEITEAAGGTYHGDPALLDQAVTGVTIDSRQATPGCLYVPFKGARVDGHSFIPQVMEAGALCALTEEDLTGDAASATHIRVGSTEKALRDLAAWYRMHLDIPVIGITGSYGKTSAKEMVSAVLGARFNVLKTAGNFNNHIGLPLTIFRIRPEHEAAVLEMGISGFGEMSMLAQIARPDIAMITTIGDCHLEQLGDRAGLRSLGVGVHVHGRRGGVLLGDKEGRPDPRQDGRQQPDGHDGDPPAEDDLKYLHQVDLGLFIGSLCRFQCCPLPFLQKPSQMGRRHPMPIWA